MGSQRDASHWWQPSCIDVRYTSIFFYPWEVGCLLNTTCQLIVHCRRCVAVSSEPTPTLISIPKSMANRPFHQALLASIPTACLSPCEVPSAHPAAVESSRLVWCSYIGQFPLAGQICFRYYHPCTMRHPLCRVVNCDIDTL